MKSSGTQLDLPLKGRISTQGSRMSYKEVRDANKISGFMAFFVLFKSCVGLGIFSYPYALSLAGMVYGGVLSFFVCYITTYGMYCLTKISTEVEQQSNRELEIDDYHFLASYIATRSNGPKVGMWMSYTANIGTVLNNIGVTISSVIEISVHIQPALDIDSLYIKLAILTVYLLISAYALEPEKLKNFVVVSGFVVLATVLVMFSDNIRLVLPDNLAPGLNYEMMDLKKTGIFLGLAGFSYEACGTIFTVRGTMKDKKYLPKLIIYVFSFIGVVYTLFSLSFYFAYGKQGIHPIAFEFYPQATRPTMFILGVIYCACLLLFVPMFNIANCELMEHSNLMKRVLEYKDGDLNRLKLVLFRWAIFTLTCAPAFLTEKIELVMGLTGAIAIPVISFYIPVALNFMHAKNSKRRRPLFWTLHDIFILLCGGAVTFLGLQHAIANIAGDHTDSR